MRSEAQSIPDDASSRDGRAGQTSCHSRLISMSNMAASKWTRFSEAAPPKPARALEDVQANSVDKSNHSKTPRHAILTGCAFVGERKATNLEPAIPDDGYSWREPWCHKEAL
jgi:hypothetical protein